MSTPKAAIWARVSSREQDTANQLPALREWARNRGYEVVAEYVLEESAWNGKHQSKLAEALEDARMGRYQVLMVWALDRLSREGIEPTLKVIRQFRERGVQVISKQEPWTDVAGEAAELVTSVMAWVANMESKRKSERVKAALVQRKQAGLPVGRQPGAMDRGPRRKSGYYGRWERYRAAKAATS